MPDAGPPTSAAGLIPYEQGQGPVSQGEEEAVKAASVLHLGLQVRLLGEDLGGVRTWRTHRVHGCEDRRKASSDACPDHPLGTQTFLKF